MSITDEYGFTLVDYDHQTGRQVWGKIEGNRQIYRIDYIVDQTIKENAEARASAPSTSIGKDYVRIGSIPANLAWSNGLVEATTQEDKKWLSRFWNDSENRAWRTDESKV